MSDVVMHVSSPEKALEEAKKNLQAANVALASIGKKNFLERQVTHDKKIAEAKSAIEAAQAQVLAAQSAVDAAKIGEALRPKQVPEQKVPEQKEAAEAKTDIKPQTETQPAPSAVDAAAERVRKLKAEGAPQIEVRAAVEAHALEHFNALKAANAPEDEVKAAHLNYTLLTEDPLVFTQLEAAKKSVRVLKAQGAPPEKIQAAEEAYNALVTGGEIISKPEEPQPSSETISQPTDAASSEVTDQPAPAQTPSEQQTAPEPTETTASQADQTTSEQQTASFDSTETTTDQKAEPTSDEQTAPAETAPTPAETATTLAETTAETTLEAPQAAPEGVTGSPSTVQEAADRVRSLKAAKAPQVEVRAAVEAYVALVGGEKQAELKTPAVPVQAGPLEIAAQRVRSLKAAKASQAEVRAAVDAYVALTGVTSTPQEVPKSVVLSTPPTPLETAAERVRSLKAARAPQAEVKAAVEAYVALTEGQVSVFVGSSLEEAAYRVRALKAARAPHAEVKAAVDAYVALRNEGSPSPKTPEEMAAEKVRILKDSNAPESEVKAAELEQAVTEAQQKVKRLKKARAPLPIVKAAVEAYVALVGGDAAAPAESASTEVQTTEAAAPAEAKGSSELERAAEKVRALKAAIAPQAEVKAAVEAYILEEAKATEGQLKATEAPQEKVQAAEETPKPLEGEPAQDTAEPAEEPTQEPEATVHFHVGDIN